VQFYIRLYFLHSEQLSKIKYFRCFYTLKKGTKRSWNITSPWNYYQCLYVRQIIAGINGDDKNQLEFVDTTRCRLSSHVFMADLATAFHLDSCLCVLYPIMVDSGPLFPLVSLWLWHSKAWISTVGMSLFERVNRFHVLIIHFFQKWYRSARVWKFFADYFPTTLIKTTDLPPDTNYIMGFHILCGKYQIMILFTYYRCHPHGILSIGAFIHLCTEATGFDKLFPGLSSTIVTLNGQFYFPFRREVGIGLGILFTDILKIWID
jgi:hypothetical protein